MLDRDGELVRKSGVFLPQPRARDLSHEVVDVPYSDLIKRTLDIVGGLALLAVFLLPMLVIATMLRMSGGPVLFRQWRVGRNGKPFVCYKFRTMVPNADQVLRELLDKNMDARAEWQENQKLLSDPRVTPLGSFLRRTSLDELPQIFTVLSGKMSLVGPRPIVRDEITRYGSMARFYLSVKPGLTGLWQVSGRNDLSYSRRVALDVLYVKKGNLSFDMLILMRTVRVVLDGLGAY